MKICIDAGHGGGDSGASFQGLKEKVVTISIATELHNLLQNSEDIDSVMTRTDDTYLGLADRVKIANHYNADYFVSIHTNADPDPDEEGMPEAKGQEIFYLSEAGKELGAAIGEGLQAEFPDEPWRGLKKRGLYVVRETAMPAVLVEVAFIDDSETNAELRDPRIRKQIAFALLRGILSLKEESDA